MKEITNGMKHDLKLVTCPQATCLERGNRTSCYLEGQGTCRFFGRTHNKGGDPKSR